MNQTPTRMRPAPGTPLSRTETRALKLLERGGSKEEVAKALGITENTLRTHANNIMLRTGGRSIENALLNAYIRGDIDPPARRKDETATISPRQLRILVAIAQARTKEQISKELSVSISTIGREITKLCNALGAESRTHLVYRAFETGNLTINRRSTES